MQNANKNSYSGSRVMRMCHLWIQNGPFAQMRIFSENLLISPVLIYMPNIKVRFSSVNEILTIKECWNLIASELFPAIAWEPGSSQACSFLRILMNHKNFRFTKIPDKTNDVIFLKSPKTLLLGHFSPLLVIFTQSGFFTKMPALSLTTMYWSLTPY